jgi:hypothetical protein
MRWHEKVSRNLILDAEAGVRRAFTASRGISHPRTLAVALNRPPPPPSRS